MKSILSELTLPSKIGHHQHWTQLPGCAQAMTLSEIAQKKEGLTVVITNTATQYQRLARETQYFLGDDLPIYTFPDWETLPYDRFSPHEDIISERIHTLSKLPQAESGLMILPAHTLMMRIMPFSALEAHSFSMEVGQTLDIEALSHRLIRTGYNATETVFSPGEFVIRGAVLDIFPMGSPIPYRLERFDDEIETIRSFDPNTQRTINKVDRIALLPGKECPLDERSINRFKQQFEDHFQINPNQCPLYTDIKSAMPAPGMEYFLPLFYESTSTIFDYLPGDPLLVTMPGAAQVTDQIWNEWHSRYEDRRYDKYYPILPPQSLILPPDEVNRTFKSYRRVTLHADDTLDTAATSRANYHNIPTISIETRREDPVIALRQFIDQQQRDGLPIFIAAESAGRRESLLELLRKHQLDPIGVDHILSLPNTPGLYVGIAPLDEGVLSDRLAIVSESQLFGQRVMQRRRRSARNHNDELAIKSLMELSIEDAVVHIDHGVGRYQGLQTLEVDEQPQEFLVLQYADEAKLYVPVSDLHLISRYGATDPDLAPLHKLGTDQWSKAKKKAAEKINDVAAELLNIYARRAAQKGIQFDIPTSDYDRFCQQFPFEETPDQADAIDAVIADLENPQPMDRLVCGDVGFGKTEVAMRAAFVAVQNEKQVAVLVPTTLLAQQHYESFRDRFADWPVKVELLSRFRTAKQSNEVLQNIKNGTVDIVVGTHKLLQSDISFKQLGLMIVDEEHRFGVTHKEKLKALRANVDLLTLTATPIPRTLNMALSGIRNLSIIATPPAKRLSIKTFVRQNDSALIKEAVLRELLRGGQVYYLHNEVKSIEQCAEKLAQLVPEARPIVAHGQMPERQLEQVMSSFYHKQYNILVCSTIIETGIDIPSANTIIIDRADHFGLAQLHQLRGRVGRSHHQAYAYLLVPSLKAISADAQKRLEAITNADHLGAGFTLASHDLEIRGAGELLGSEQSGHVNAIGYTLYMDMLNRAVKAIRSGKDPALEQPLDLHTVVNLRVSAIIPDDYIPDVHNRLLMYKRISSATSQDELDQLKIEMIDRFGLLPAPLQRLFQLAGLRIQSQQLGINKIESNSRWAYLHFNESTSIEPIKLVKLVQNHPTKYTLSGASTLKYLHEEEQADQRIAAVNDLIISLTGN